MRNGIRYSKNKTTANENLFSAVKAEQSEPDLESSDEQVSNDPTESFFNNIGSSISNFISSLPSLGRLFPISLLMSGVVGRQLQGGGRNVPTMLPTEAIIPTIEPTTIWQPSFNPTDAPTEAPSEFTDVPTEAPSESVDNPTEAPSESANTGAPTNTPTVVVNTASPSLSIAPTSSLAPTNATSHRSKSSDKITIPLEIFHGVGGMLLGALMERKFVFIPYGVKLFAEGLHASFGTSVPVVTGLVSAGTVIGGSGFFAGMGAAIGAAIEESEYENHKKSGADFKTVGHKGKIVHNAAYQGALAGATGAIGGIIYNYGWGSEFKFIELSPYLTLALRDQIGFKQLQPSLVDLIKQTPDDDNLAKLKAALMAAMLKLAKHRYISLTESHHQTIENAVASGELFRAKDICLDPEEDLIASAIATNQKIADVLGSTNVILLPADSPEYELLQSSLIYIAANDPPHLDDADDIENGSISPTYDLILPNTRKQKGEEHKEIELPEVQNEPEQFIEDNSIFAPVVAHANEEELSGGRECSKNLTTNSDQISSSSNNQNIENNTENNSPILTRPVVSDDKESGSSDKVANDTSSSSSQPNPTIAAPQGEKLQPHKKDVSNTISHS